MSYEEEFEIFSTNINQAARAFYYHQEIQRQVYDDGVKHENMPDGNFQDSKLFQAIQANAQFWNDYKYSSILHTIIALGRIFDRNRNAHSIERLLKLAKKTKLFTKDELRKRKIAGSSNSSEWIDDYMKTTLELSENHFQEIGVFINNTKKRWDNMKDIRNKIFAHQEVMDAGKKAAILEQSTYENFEEIINELLTVEYIFSQAFHNGKEPDFDYQDTAIHKRVQKDVSELLSRLK